MNNFFLLVVCYLFLSCSSSDDDTNPEISRSFQLDIDSKSMNFVNEQFSMNENCDRIFINMSTSSMSNPKFFLEIKMTVTGHLEEVFYVDYEDNDRHYRSADFDTSENFKITTFAYGPSNKFLEIAFSGNVYEYGQPKNSKAIKGTIQEENLESISCSHSPWFITADINENQSFQSVQMQGKTDSESTRWMAISDNGFKIKLITEQTLQHMPPGTYAFGKDDPYNKVIIEQYVGPEGATRFIQFIEEQWETYDYEGELIIDAPSGNFSTVTKGSFNLNALKGGEVIYSITNGRFSI
ncbi:hypothetical protein J8281_08365 [Aquimarina sp. U1-2]|uniref:hypothetical protein n=1 Tax=Aquimarina sp. U1-2 TaxID=2823141 RepID=UPI001AECDD0C|nr:hypothetical protein [Aquimarina sp. U1-2]MBP2832201.1 hypothetical protein [Aquimarina sp. U1-2]